MREPQVDTFCRCVKKVKKTLKAREGSTKEQGAIAVCTKSVLQSKGRTLRKVRCRDGVLETQPMKGGVDQMGGEADQIGGKFKWMGADTPVFNNETPDPEKWNGFPVMKKPTPEKNQVWLDGLITKYNPVVRMVSGGLDGELPYHKMLREMLENTDPFNQPFVKMHFNLMAEPDSMYPVDYDATLTQVKLQGEPKMTKRLIDAGIRFGTNNWFGLVTRTQKSDVYNLATINQRDAMCDLLRVLLRIDGRIIHADLHRGNMAIMYDGTPVIHDVGRMKIRDPKVDEVLGAPIERAFYYALLTRFYKPNYYMGLSQHFYIARMFKKIRKLYGETFPPPTKENEWEREDPVPTPDNYAKFQKWLNDPATGGKDGETNCFQIARVYDILSILKGLSDLSVDRTAQLSAYYYARKTAVTLTSYLLAGFATKENVNKIVRDFLALSGTMGRCGGKPVGDEKPDAPEDRYAAEYMGRSDETRGNKALVAPAPVPAPAPVVSPLRPEEADLSAAGQAEIALRSHEDDLNRARIESLSEKKGDAEALEELSAIRGVTETPPEVKAAADKAFVLPPKDAAEEAVGVGLELRAESKSANVEVEDAVLAKVGPNGEYNAKAAAPMKGGVFKGVGMAAITFKAHNASWDFLPTPVDPAAREAAERQAEGAGYPAEKTIAYISADKDILTKHDIVRTSKYAPHALTYVALYTCNLSAFVALPGTPWVRDELTRRLRSNVPHFPEGFKSKQLDVLEGAMDAFGKYPPCLLIPKFKQTVGTLKVAEGVKAMISVLDGLCVDKGFIIDDLHADNMAVMSDDRAVTFDYDRVRTEMQFAALFKKILTNPLQYLDLPQYDHVMKLGSKKLTEYAAPTLNHERDAFFVNYDLLSVLSSLKFICSKTPAAVAAVETCMQGIIGVDSVKTLAAALAGVGDGDERTIEELVVANAFKSDENTRNDWNVWDEHTKQDWINSSNPRRGGTFRRRRLPRLL